MVNATSSTVNVFCTSTYLQPCQRDIASLKSPQKKYLQNHQTPINPKTVSSLLYLLSIARCYEYSLPPFCWHCINHTSPSPVVLLYQALYAYASGQ